MAGISQRLNLQLDVDQSGGPVVGRTSQRFNLVTDRIGFGVSGLFSLNTGNVALTADYYHLGDDPTPPCTPAGNIISGSTAAAINFSVTSSELSDYMRTGAQISLMCYQVDATAQTELQLNGNTLAPLPVNVSCQALEYRFPVTAFLHSGTNTLSVALKGTGDLPDLVFGEAHLIAGVGQDNGAVSVAVSPFFDQVGFQISYDGAPFDDARVEILAGEQVLLAAIPQAGSVDFTGLQDGTFRYVVRPIGGSGTAFETGQFTIDRTNNPPVITQAEASPSVAGNDGGSSVSLAVTANDNDGGITSVAVNLVQLGGSEAFMLTDHGGGQFGASYTVPAGTPTATYTLPLHVTDDRGAVTIGSIALEVTPSQALDPTVLTACGFEIRASNITESTPGIYQASGNVQITHPASGLPLLLDASGAVTVTTGAMEQITADADVTLKANLGSLGVVDLAHGQFTIASDGSLQLDPNATALLSKISDFELDNGSMNFGLLLGDPAGIQVTAHAIFDELDGVPDNNYPAADMVISLLTDGTVSGVLNGDPGVLSWDLAGGTLSFESISWLNSTVTLNQTSFALDMSLFDSGSQAIEVDVPTCTFGPDGFHTEGVAINNFTFEYGGFAFAVDGAHLTNDHIQVNQACLTFPIPHRGDVSSCVYDLEISDAGVNLAGGEIRVPPLKIGSYDLAGVYAHFDSGPEGFVLKAEGSLAIPAFATVGIEFALDSNCQYLLQEFCMAAEFAGRGIPIGSTGFLLTDISGCLEDQGCQNDWLITFTAGFASADRVDPPGLSLISADVQVKIEPQPFRLGADGTLFLVGQQLSAGGFNLYGDRFEGWGNLQVPPGLPFLVAQSNLDIHWSPSFDFTGQAQGILQVPADEIPLYRLFYHDPIQLGGFTAQVDMAGIRGAFSWGNGSSEPDMLADYSWETGQFSFHPAWNSPTTYFNTATGQQFGILRHDRYLLERSPGSKSAPVAMRPQVYLGEGVGLRPAFWSQDTGDVSAQDKTTAFAYLDTTETVVVPPQAAPMLVTMEETPAGAVSFLTLSLVSPSDTAIDSLYCEGTPGCTYLRGDDAAMFRIDTPEAGNWKVVVGNIDTGENYTLEVRFLNRAPVVDLTAPTEPLAVTTDDSVLITWSATDPDPEDAGTLTTAIYAIAVAPQKGDDAGPWLVAEHLPDSVQNYVWLPQGLPSGDYRLVTKTSDTGRGAMAKTATDTSAVITLDNVNAPWRVSDLELSVGPESLLARWNGLGRDDLRGYRLFWSETGSGWIDTLDVGRSTRYLLSSLKEGVDYDVWVEAYDVMNLAGPASEHLTAAPHPLGDVQAPPVPTGLQATYDGSSGVVSATWNMEPDAVSYRLHYDFDVVGTYRGTGAAEGDSPVLQGRAESLTLTGLMPGRRYYLAVSALDAAGNESATSDPVPVLVSGFTDTDADGLPDDWEQANLGSLEYGPTDDPDGDFLDNATELNITLTHPGLDDTDGDHVVDGNDAHPLAARDLDNDGMADDWETEYSVTDPDADPDQDFLTNVREFTAQGLPHDPDTDDDGLGDGFEVDTTGTAVWNPDTDGGGLSDGKEYNVGRDPLDPADDALDLSGVNDPGNDVPKVTRLGRPAPNPFNARLRIPFALSKPGLVRLALYDIRGRRVRQLVAESYPAGRWETIWDGHDDHGAACASGIYFIRFRSGEKTQLKKTMLVK